jgi:hypothetical protein
MNKHEIFEKLELPNRIITRSSSLLSFKSGNSNTHMSSSNHVNIISSIPDSKSGILWVVLAYHCDYLGFLLGAYPASNNNFSSLSKS